MQQSKQSKLNPLSFYFQVIQIETVPEDSPKGGGAKEGKREGNLPPVEDMDGSGGEVIKLCNYFTG